MVRDVQVIGQHKSAHHATLVLVVVDLLEGGAAVAGVEQKLVKLRRVLFHHICDLVVHVVPHAICLHQLLAGFLAQHLRTHGAFGRQQFFERLGLELDDALGEQRMAHAARAFEGTGALFNVKAQELKALAVLIFPFLA